MCIRDLVSIVVPVYNGERFLHENVNSILNQSYKNLEIIYVCDGCTDMTMDILKEYSIIDSRIRVCIEKTNHGAAFSRNIGLGMARGEWIIFLDSDDLFETDMIELMLARAVERKAEVCCCYLECFDNEIAQDGQISNEAIRFYGKSYPCIKVPDEKKYILQLVSNSSCTKLVHRNVYKNKVVYFPEIPNCEDVYYSSVVAMESDKIVYVDDKILLHYRSNVGRNTVTTNQLNMRNYIWEACDNVYQYIKQKTDNREFKQSFYNRVCQFVYDYCGYANRISFMETLRVKYFKKWGMDDRNLVSQLSYLNREIYYKICVSDFEFDKALIYLLAQVNFVKDMAKGSGCSIWGCGEKGKKLLDAIGMDYKGIYHLYDSDSNKWGTKILDLLIEGFDMDQTGDVIVTSTRYYDDIKRQIGNRASNVYDLEKEIYKY